MKHDTSGKTGEGWHLFSERTTMNKKHDIAKV